MMKTPATAIRRKARPGELLLSAAGSPVSNVNLRSKGDSDVVSMSIGGDKVRGGGEREKSGEQWK